MRFRSCRRLLDCRACCCYSTSATGSAAITGRERGRHRREAPLRQEPQQWPPSARHAASTGLQETEQGRRRWQRWRQARGGTTSGTTSGPSVRASSRRSSQPLLPRPAHASNACSAGEQRARCARSPGGRVCRGLRHPRSAAGTLNRSGIGSTGSCCSSGSPHRGRSRAAARPRPPRFPSREPGRCGRLRGAERAGGPSQRRRAAMAAGTGCGACCAARPPASCSHGLRRTGGAAGGIKWLGRQAAGVACALGQPVRLGASRRWIGGGHIAAGGESAGEGQAPAAANPAGLQQGRSSAACATRARRRAAATGDIRRRSNRICARARARARPAAGAPAPGVWPGRQAGREGAGGARAKAAPKPARSRSSAPRHAARAQEPRTGRRKQICLLAGRASRARTPPPLYTAIRGLPLPAAAARRPPIARQRPSSHPGPAGPLEQLRGPCALQAVSGRRQHSAQRALSGSRGRGSRLGLRGGASPRAQNAGSHGAGQGEAGLRLSHQAAADRRQRCVRGAGQRANQLPSHMEEERWGRRGSGLSAQPPARRCRQELPAAEVLRGLLHLQLHHHHWVGRPPLQYTAMPPWRRAG
jgi:hypothetical protein